MQLNKKRSDLNKDGKLSSYEKKRGMAIQKSMMLRRPNDKKFMGMTSYKENK